MSYRPTHHANPELVERASALVPLLRERAAGQESRRRLDDDVVDMLAREGLLDLRRPARHGGSDAGAHTVVEVLAELARGDGSTAWTASAWTISAWIACRFPDHVQDEVFGDPRSRVCAVLSPSASGTPVDGGLLIEGRWPFVSGFLHSDWQVVMAMAPSPSGEPWPVMAVVPTAELTVEDDWETAGLRATGSVSTVARGVLVPEDRILPVPLVIAGQHASESTRGSATLDTPMVPTGCVSFAGVAVGLARAAHDAFFERLPARKITYTDYARQADSTVTHLEVAEAAMTLAEAEFHAHLIADLVDGIGAGEWKLEDRVLARASLGRTFSLVENTVDVLARASGGSSVYLSEPIQRIRRDVNVLAQHALMHPSTNAELYGRVLCGLEPNSTYL